jgi:regulatory protein
MNIISIKTGADMDVRRVELSDGSVFSFKIGYLPPGCTDESLYGEGLELSAAEEEGLRFASACMRAEKTALQLIARAEQTAFGLSRKLEKRGHDSPCVRAVIQRLCETGLLDDRRYARLWLDMRISRQASSPRRLLAALCARGIDRHDAEQALKETLDDSTEQQLVERYVQKQRDPCTDDSDAAARRSLRYQLKNEGFSSMAIQWLFDNND